MKTEIQKLDCGCVVEVGVTPRGKPQSQVIRSCGKDSLDQLRERVDAEYTIKAKPLYPRVLVRVLGKELMYKGTIIIPDSPGQNMQHKPVYEGIVLAVYESKWIQHRTLMDDDAEDWPSGKGSILIEPIVKVGDHILFPHYEGQKLYSTDDVKFIPEHSIVGILEYTRKPGEVPVSRTITGFMRPQK